MHFLFAWRYFKAKKSTNVINIIAWVCITAIVIGTAALILVLSVFNGFEGLVKSLYSAFYPDLKISAAVGKVITISPAQQQQLKALKDIRNFSLVVEEKALLQSYDNQSLVTVKGVDSQYRHINTVSEHISGGDYDFGTPGQPLIVLGAGVESSLGILADKFSDALTIYIPQKKGGTADLNVMDNISSDTIHAVGSFMIQQDFDNKYALTNLGFLKSRLQMAPDEYTAVEIAVASPDKTELVQKQISTLLGKAYKVETRYQQNQSLYSVMRMERWIFYAVLCLILVVAAFNMVGALTMLVLEKQKDISILNALGAPRSFVQKVFLSEGFLLAIIGGGIGMLLALVMVLLQLKFHLIPLEGGSFLINYFPAELKLTDFILVSVTVSFIAFIASWLPARKASHQKFSLRSE